MSAGKVRGLQLKVNGLFWAGYLHRVCIPQVRILRETVFDRALPAFDRIEEEADRVEQATWDRRGDSAGPDADPGDLAEAAIDAGVDHYLMRIDAQQSLRNLFAVALHHLLEQQLLFVLRRELLPKEEENNPAHFTRPRVIEEFAAQGIDLKTFPEWSCLEELRLLANTVKHADGSAAKQLMALNARLFVAPTLRDQPEHGPVVAGQVFTPLAGDDVYVTAPELGAYFDCVDAFLLRLAEAMTGLASP